MGCHNVSSTKIVVLVDGKGEVTSKAGPGRKAKDFRVLW